MFCPQCGAQAEISVKFCRACGLNLSEYSRLFANPEPDSGRENLEQAERALRLLKATRALAAAFFSSLLFLLLAGLLIVWLILLKDDADPSLTLLLIPLFSLPVLLGSLGMYHLWRGKYFKTLRDRLIKAYALLLVEQSKNPGRFAPKPETPSEVAETSSFQSPVAPISIAEPTTRELQPMTSNSGKIA